MTIYLTYRCVLTSLNFNFTYRIVFAKLSFRYSDYVANDFYELFKEVIVVMNFINE